MAEGTCSTEGCERPVAKRQWCDMHYRRLLKSGSIAAVTRPTALDRYKANVVVMASGCLEWTGSCDTQGYGQFRVAGRNTLVHRWAYETFVGPIPYDKPNVLHHCDNPPCVRADPDPLISHLFVGTFKDNADDMIAKHRDSASLGTHPELLKTHCPAGHPYAGDNLKIRVRGSRGQGWRVCRTCEVAYERERTIRRRKK